MEDKVWNHYNIKPRKPPHFNFIPSSLKTIYHDISKSILWILEALDCLGSSSNPFMWRSNEWSPDRAWSRNDDLPVKILPSAGWAEDSKCHHLLIGLPDFENNEIKIQIEDSDHIKITGQRKSGNKIIYFDKTYTVPDNNIDIKSASVKLEGGILTITIFKKAVPSPLVEECNDEEIAKGERIEKKFNGKSSSDKEDMKKDYQRECCKESNRFKSFVKVINKNKGMISTLLAAFILGMLVSRKVETRRSKEDDRAPNS